MASQMVRAVLDQVPDLEADDIDDLLLGCGQPAGEAGFNLARVVAVQLGLDAVPGTTVNRYCASSLQTTRMAFHAIKAGEGTCFLSVGVEAVSRYVHGRADGGKETHNPAFADAEARTAAAADSGAASWTDPRDGGAVPDIYIGMGQTAENVALAWSISREDMDWYAVQSQQRAERAADAGFWAREITPLLLGDGTSIDRDDSPRRSVTLEAVAALEPVFRPGGRVTAGNCCPLNDGAAAVLVMSGDEASKRGLTPLARIIATGVSGLSPEIMGVGPVEASRRALRLAGMSIADVDLVELNEAFASQVLASQRELGIDMDKLNVHGGAIALGHPFGMTGARITTTLLHGLRERDESIGLATMCVGGGQGMALVLERLS